MGSVSFKGLSSASLQQAC